MCLLKNKTNPGSFNQLDMTMFCVGVWGTLSKLRKNAVWTLGCTEVKNDCKAHIWTSWCNGTSQSTWFSFIKYFHCIQYLTKQHLTHSPHQMLIHHTAAGDHHCFPYFTNKENKAYWRLSDFFVTSHDPGSLCDSIPQKKLALQSLEQDYIKLHSIQRYGQARGRTVVLFFVEIYIYILFLEELFRWFRVSNILFFGTFPSWQNFYWHRLSFIRMNSPSKYFPSK